MLKCPECNAEYQFATGLGRHRQTAHGIAGAKATISKRYNKKKKKAKVTIQKNAKPVKTSHNPRKENRQTISNEEATVLITVGKFTAICEAIANSHNIPTKQFTERCATVFYASQVRR